MKDGYTDRPPQPLPRVGGLKAAEDAAKAAMSKPIPVNARGERIYPLELPKEQRDKIAFEEAIREKMLHEMGGSIGFKTAPRSQVRELARLCSLDLGREVTEDTIRGYLTNGDYIGLEPVWKGFGEEDVREIKATLMKEILGP